MPFPGYAKPDKQVLDAGLITVGGFVAALSATKGGVKFDPKKEVHHTEFDGRRAQIRGQHRITGWEPTISGLVLSASDANIIRYNPGASSDGSATNTITHKAADSLWVDGDYLEDVYMIQRRADEKVYRVHFPVAYVAKCSLATTDKGDNGFEIEIVAVLDSDETDLTLCPYTEEIAD